MEFIISLSRVLEYLDKEDIEYVDSGNHYLLSTSVCHNGDSENKLYLYKNNGENPLFHCYTRCGTFNVIQLVMKRHYNKTNEEITYKQACKIFFTNTTTVAKSEIVNKYAITKEEKLAHPKDVQLQEYPLGIMDLYYEVDGSPWHQEGVSVDSLNLYGVAHNSDYRQTLIPHFDYRGRLIGYRVRNFYNSLAKYLPLIFNETVYSHPLSLNLFGVNNYMKFNPESPVLFLYEGEKSVLVHHTMLGKCNALAVCGSNISNFQKRFINLVLKPKVVVVAFDKEYRNVDEMLEYIENVKIKAQGLWGEVYLLVDNSNLLQYKDSPMDRSINEFNKLVKVKIS